MDKLKAIMNKAREQGLKATYNNEPVPTVDIVPNGTTFYTRELLPVIAMAHALNLDASITVAEGQPILFIY